MSALWIDTHCHLDAPEFDADRDAVLARACAAGVAQLVIPSVCSRHFAVVQALAVRHGLACALGVHPLYVDQECADQNEEVALEMLQRELRRCLGAPDGHPHVVAVGEIGLDGAAHGLNVARQQRFFEAQLQIARDVRMPVILHVRRSVDAVLKALRRVGGVGGIAHAFNGSEQQARMFIDLGFKLGFGGAMTFDRALQLRHLAATLPLDALVLETDAPDIPPHWLYKTAAQRQAGERSRNEPAELPRIAAALAAVRGMDVATLAQATRANVLAVLPRLSGVCA